MTTKRIIPTESQEQQTLFAWARLMEKKHPELEFLTHIPNGGFRNKSEAARFKAEGVRKGFPDIILPVARQGYHSLAIELKRRQGGRLTTEQRYWLNNLTRQGWYARVCNGADEAIRVIDWYLRGD